MRSPVQYLPSQVPAKTNNPLQWTGSPFLLLWNDVILFLQLSPSLPWLLNPLVPFNSGALDELYPSLANIGTLLVHAFLFVYQIAFLISLIPSFFMLPTWLATTCIVLGVLFNQTVCNVVLNGPRTLQSTTHVSGNPTYKSEYWLFINGVTVG